MRQLNMCYSKSSSPVKSTCMRSAGKCKPLWHCSHYYCMFKKTCRLSFTDFQRTSFILNQTLVCYFHLLESSKRQDFYERSYILHKVLRRNKNFNIWNTLHVCSIRAMHPLTFCGFADELGICILLSTINANISYPWWLALTRFWALGNKDCTVLVCMKYIDMQQPLYFTCPPKKCT